MRRLSRYNRGRNLSSRKKTRKMKKPKKKTDQKLSSPSHHQNTDTHIKKADIIQPIPISKKKRRKKILRNRVG